jgi:catechol 2,3-dioxygenase
MEIKMAQTDSDQLTIGKVHYNVSNLERAAYFFEEGFGMKLIDKSALSITLGTLDDQPLLVLHKVNNPIPRKKTTGLYHIAIRLPNREELARLIYHMVNNQIELDGVADHGVSEALYLTGPEDMGIELYCDREYEDWPIDDEGQLEMVTEELDIDNLMLTLQGKTKKWGGMPAGTSIGHIHLKVAELENTAEFYTQLGFEVTQEYGDQAIFFASGEYHHHIGANTWQSAGASPLDVDTAGLNYFEIIFPNQTQLDELAESLSAADLTTNKIENEFELIDPNGIRLRLVPAT